MVNKMNIDAREIELKEIPTPVKSREPAPAKVDVGSSEFFEALARANNEIIEIIELNNPAKLKSFSISSGIEDSLDIIGPILIKNFKEKGWQLSIVKEPKRASRKGMPDFDGEHAACSIAEVDTRSLPAKFLEIFESFHYLNIPAKYLALAFFGVAGVCLMPLIGSVALSPLVYLLQLCFNNFKLLVLGASFLLMIYVRIISMQYKGESPDDWKAMQFEVLIDSAAIFFKLGLLLGLLFWFFGK
jgi:hypothetical protein